MMETHARVDPLTGFPSVNYWPLSGVASKSSVVRFWASFLSAEISCLLHVQLA